MGQGMVPHEFTEVAMGIFDYVVKLNAEDPFALRARTQRAGSAEVLGQRHVPVHDANASAPEPVMSLRRGTPLRET